jgi:hypothetical protein
MEAFIENVLLDPFKQFMTTAAAFVPSVLTALLLLIFGLVIAWFIKLLITRFLRVLQVDVLAEKSGIAGAFRNVGIKDSISTLTGRIIYWLVVIIFLTMALHALRMPAVEEFIAKFFLYLPNVIVAVIVIVLGYLMGNFLGRATLIASVNADLPIGTFLSRFVKVTIYIISASMALELLGIGKDTVLLTFAIVFGGIVLALAIAFGLGGKEAAQEYLEKKLKEKKNEQENIEHI